MLLEFVHAKFGAQAYRTKIGYRINFDTWLAMDSSYCSQTAAVCIHSCIRGHHIYKDILATSCGEKAGVYTEHETGHDDFADRSECRPTEKNRYTVE